MRPIDIETATFDVSRRGYDRRQVDAYLARVAFAFRSAAHRYGIDWAKESCGCGSGHDLDLDPELDLDLEAEVSGPA